MVQNDKTAEAAPAGGEQSPGPVPGEACAEAPGPAEESGIAVEATGLRKFTSGVVEGNNQPKIHRGFRLGAQQKRRYLS